MHPRQRSAPFVITAVVIIAITALILSSCGTSGRTLRDPKTGATAPDRKNSGSISSESPAPSGAVITGAAFSFSTAAWPSGGAIPRAYTCDGANTSPPLTISNSPKGAVELVLVVTNQNTPTESLWMLAGIGPLTMTIPQGGVPSGAIQIVNSSGVATWRGPCPKTDQNIYEFSIYALNKPSGLTAVSTRADVEEVISTASNASAFTGNFKR